MHNLKTHKLARVNEFCLPPISVECVEKQFLHVDVSKSTVYTTLVQNALHIINIFKMQNGNVFLKMKLRKIKSYTCNCTNLAEARQS